MARGGGSAGTHQGPAPEQAHWLAGSPGAECERAERVGRLVLEPSQELVETCGGRWGEGECSDVCAAQLPALLPTPEALGSHPIWGAYTCHRIGFVLNTLEIG